MRDLIIFSNSNSRVVLTEIRVLKFKKYTFLIFKINLVKFVNRMLAIEFLFQNSWFN